MSQTQYLKATTSKELISQVQAEFIQQFKSEPKYLSLAPGRINIIGEHTDYNDGLAMPAAIDRWICAAVHINSNKSSTIYSLSYNEGVVITPQAPEKFKRIWKQLTAMAINLITTEFDIKQGVNMALGSNIPIGCGLSSSTAFVIAITQTICQLFSIRIRGRKLAYLCQRIENDALGINGGLLDQYSIILSKKNHFMAIDFHNDNIQYFSVSLKGYSWIVINSQIQRELSESAYIQRVNECKEGLEILKGEFNISSFRDIDLSMLQYLKNKSNVLYNRLCHVLGENDRVQDMKDQLQKCALDKVGTILKESHESLKSLYDVSCKEIDFIIELSISFEGWYGGRIIGGGFGGCSLHLVADQAVEDYNSYIIDNYTKKYDIIPDILKVTFPGGSQYLLIDS